MQWQDVLNDATLRDLPYKIELNLSGNIEMSPTYVIHSILQGELITLLSQSLKGGQALGELAIQTLDGVRVPDVCWGSRDYIQAHQDELYASKAPELCVEIVSRSNSQKEMKRKTALFMEAGATEVWWVTQDRKIQIFNKAGQLDRSQFPVDLTPYQN